MIKFAKTGTQTLLLLLFVAGCGTTNPTPVVIDLIDRYGGDVVEIVEILSVEAFSRFREVFPSVLGEAEELLIGKMNGIDYVALFEISLAPTDFPGGDPSVLSVDSLFVELKLLGNLTRGELGRIAVSAPDEVWSESRSFVDSTDFLTTSFRRTALTDVMPGLADSTVRVALPPDLLRDAIVRNPTAPVLEFELTGAGDAANYLIVVGSREATEPAKVPQLVAYFGDGAGVARVGASLDTYFADRTGDPESGDLLIQTGVLTGAVMRFDLPTIPESATVNLVELTMDFDIDRSFLTGLRLRVERIDVAGSDTTFTLESGNPLNEQIVTPVSSPFRMNLDQLLIHGWMSGTSENRGLIINPVFEIVQDLRYEWGLFTNPRIRVIYSLAPPIGT